MKTNKAVFFLGIVLLCTIVGCNPNRSKISDGIEMQEADSILNAGQIYSLEYDSFISFLDSVEQLISPDTDPISVKYHFLEKSYAYNLNHSLILILPDIEMFFDYQLIAKKKYYSDDELLINESFQKALFSYLDLTSKYRIAEGASAHTDNIFINTQFDIIEEELSGKIKEFALFKVLEHQLSIFGYEGAGKMVDSFHKQCSNALYTETIDNLYAELVALRAETDERIYKISGQDSLSAYIYYPENKTRNMPCLVIFHGGGWYIGHPLTRLHIPKQFNEMGFVAIELEGRTKGRQDVTPVEGLMDAKAAIRWVRQNSDALGIDPNKIIAGGLSSGGTLAADCALVNGFEYKEEDLSVSSTPNAVILWSANVDVTASGWFNYCLNNKVDCVLLSPTQQIDNEKIPFLVFQGTLDDQNDYATHMTFNKKMKENGNYCKLVLFENTEHIEVYDKDMMQYYKDFISLAFKD